MSGARKVIWGGGLPADTIFLEIDGLRARLGVTYHALCKAAGVPCSTWWRAKTGRVRWQSATEQKFRAALVQGVGKPPPKIRMTEQRQQLVLGVFRGSLIALAHGLGLDPNEASARPGARAFWKARALALYCTAVEFDIRGADLARALGMSKQLVSWNLRQAEDMRDDPAIDGLVERTGRLIAARDEA